MKSVTKRPRRSGASTVALAIRVRRLCRGGGGPAAPGHEGVELLAVLGALELFDELGEAAGLLLEAATLLLEPLKLAPATLVEGEVAGRREMRPRPEALREPAE